MIMSLFIQQFQLYRAGNHSPLKSPPECDAGANAGHRSADDATAQEQVLGDDVHPCTMTEN
ncbi:MAG: hypothetical protein CSB44_00310 [Gammaproteobacteria bacterium]|nr:MAG: hypothetical protein CSB44_00310 [Gammaproteobacteria bacterium]